MEKRGVTVTNSARINFINVTKVVCLVYCVGYIQDDCRLVVQLPEAAMHYCLLLGV